MLPKKVMTPLPSQLEDTERFFSSNIAAITSKGQSLWITCEKSTKVIQRDGSIVPDPDLPVALHSPSIHEVKPYELYMLIGGQIPGTTENYSKATYVYSVSSDNCIGRVDGMSTVLSTQDRPRQV